MLMASLRLYPSLGSSPSLISSPSLLVVAILLTQAKVNHNIETGTHSKEIPFKNAYTKVRPAGCPCAYIKLNKYGTVCLPTKS